MKRTSPRTPAGRPRAPGPARIDLHAVAVMALLALGAEAQAAGLEISVQIPAIAVAEYHRPYVAVWIEREDQSVAANLAVWYETGDAKGVDWLKDLRQWWRRSGRTLQLPVDGVSGATRAAGTHALKFDDGAAALAGLAPGSYRLVVEAAREVGGRELLKIPFQWPASAALDASAQGQSELGAITLAARP